MAPSEWWDGKEIHRGTPMVVKMENPNWSIAEIDVPPEEGFLSPVNRNKGKMRGKSAKQLTWVLLLRVHRAAGRLSSIASATFGLVAVIRRRVKAGKTDFEELASDNGTNNDISIEHAGSVDSRRVRALFFSIIKAFLIVPSTYVLGDRRLFQRLTF